MNKVYFLWGQRLGSSKWLRLPQGNLGITCTVPFKEKRRMVAKELILTKHLFCARHMASFLRVQMNLFHAKILQDDHFHLQVRLRCGRITYPKSYSSWEAEVGSETRSTELLKPPSSDGGCNPGSITAASWWPWKSLDWLLGHQVSSSFWCYPDTNRDLEMLSSL